MKPIVKKCDNCGKEFEVCHKDRLENRNHLFCCKKCEGEFRKKETLNKSFVICPVCGAAFHLKPSALKKAKQKPCCSYRCMSEYRKIIYKGDKNPNYGNKGSKNPTWKSDKKINPYGYILVRKEDHPFKNTDGFVFEHRLVAEQYLLNDENSIQINGKKYLSPNYIVHHKDENRQNNSIENLQVMTLSEHTRYHRKGKKKLAS